MRREGLAAAALAAALACSNNPYPDADATRKVYYTALREAPRTLDPAEAYNVVAHAITGNVYDTLLEYHYLKRPYTLIPGLAREVPEARTLDGGRVAYRFRLREGLLFADDPAFALSQRDRTTREVEASDVAFQLMRLADPDENSPVVDPFSHIVGFRAFQERLVAAREADPELASRTAREQYEAAGGIEGVVVGGPYELDVVLSGPYPQILYWFAMEFSTPVPWEAVAWYDGVARERFDDHPVGTGPFRIGAYDKQLRIVLERNPNWYGVRHPEWKAPGAVYPAEGEPGDAAKGLLDPEVVGRPLPFLERIEFRREKESIPRFNKFLQGYYDASGIIKESFDKVIQNGRLSPEMAERGIVLDKSISPGVYYMGFNMDDPVLGRPAGERGRKLRLAISHTVDAERWIELFLNGRGVPAQSPVPPGIFGYEAGYQNPTRRLDLARARELLAEAGYPDGIDPETDKPLHLTFDSYSTSSSQLLSEQFLADALRGIGLDVDLDATTYNQFQKKVQDGSYQMFFWGWSADYPDPENFLFLLTCDMRRSESGGPNYTNYCNPAFDALFRRMRVRPDDEERLAAIREMRGILEHDRPWIEMFHPEDYTLYHGWLEHVKPFGMSFPMSKYVDLDAQERAGLREAWNRPVTWPAWALLGITVLLILPGIRTFFRERQ
jgi:ABC-type transport system substrate-binding protein